MMYSTKERIAKAIKEISARKSLQKITINDIAKKCNMTRENFYYHFRDKYDIIHWIIKTEIIDLLPETDNFMEWYQEIISAINIEKNFYGRILKEMGKETFEEDIYPLIEEKIRKEIENLSCDSLWTRRREKIDFVSEFYANAFMNLIYQGIFEPGKQERKVFRGNLEFLFEQYLPFVRYEKEM